MMGVSRIEKALSYRLAFYPIDESSEPVFVGATYSNSISDKLLMKAVIEEVNRLWDNGNFPYAIAAFPVKMEAAAA